MKEKSHMLQIEDTLISLDLLEKKFVCNLPMCLGACCIEGDSGAPLDEIEILLLPLEYPNIQPFMRPEGITAVEKNGFYFVDKEGDTVTMLVEGEECAYAVFDDRKAFCSIEKAYEEKKTTMRKPVSCHLYPVRIKEYENFTAVNYDSWYICNAARAFGEIHDVPLYIFLKEALIRRFGEEWYEQLKYSAEHIDEINV